MVFVICYLFRTAGSATGTCNSEWDWLVYQIGVTSIEENFQNEIQRVMQVPSAFIIALNGLVVVFVVSSEIWRRRRQRQRTMDVASEADNGASMLPETEVTA